MNWICFGRSNRKRLTKALITRYASRYQFHQSNTLLFHIKEYANHGDYKYFYAINENHRLLRIM